jgi:serine kinase of HPr protein (carbohydrate metabolism regulator)
MRSANIHASCVVPGSAGKSFGAPEDAGILLLGPSGSGKSDLALRLIERGAVLVADDRVELFVREGTLWGRAPAALAGLLEIRGTGIVKLEYRPETPIAIAIGLGSAEAARRLPDALAYEPPEGLGLRKDASPPLLRLCAFESSAQAKVLAATAAIAHALFRDGRKSI